MTQEELKEFGKQILDKTRAKYGAYMLHKQLPEIFFIKPEELLKITYKKYVPVNDNVLYQYAIANYGLSIRDEHVENFICKYCDGIFPKESVFVFDGKYLNDDQIKSVLCHELMHFFFIGINNESDKGQGYNEACTDYIANEIFGKGYFSSYYSVLESYNTEYMKYYRKFYYGNEEVKQPLIKRYLNVND